MEANYYTGIDISKKRLDWQVNDGQNRPLAIGDIGNSPDGIRELLEKWTHQGISLEKMVVCFEHTGAYGLLLAAMLEEAAKTNHEN